MSSNIDRGWMYQRNKNGYLDLDWCAMVDTKFLDFAFSQEAHVKKRNIEGQNVVVIRCPCKVCKLNNYKVRMDVKVDLCKYGFLPGYTTWLSHGETNRNFQETRHCSNSSPTERDNIPGCSQMVLDNINAANSHFETFQEHTYEEQAPNASAQKYYDMLKDADEPLWEGCNVTKLQAATRLLHWKSENNVAVSTYDRLLPIIKEMLPEGEKLFSSFYETKAMLKELRLKKERIDACKNHCMLFYKEFRDLTHCTVCNESRYKSGKIPNLVLTYLPIVPRLQRLYMLKKTAKEMTWHSYHQQVSDKMAHPSDGEAWKHFDSINPFFAEEIRNVRLGLCTDGFSPNNTSSNPYSLWPVFLTIYNLPPWMSLKDSYVQLSLVIPGKKSPGQNLDVFLRPLIDELKMLYDDGVDTYDAYRKQNFTMRAILLWTVSDFPAYAMLSGWSTHGKLACPSCMKTTDSFQLTNGGKPCWFDCHRRFLPNAHSFRRDRKGFRDGDACFATPPQQLSGLEIWRQVRGYPTVYEGQPYRPSNKKIPGFGKTHNWVKRSIFWELPYWHTLLIRHNLDVMHIEKNVFENLFNTIMDTLKTKDNIKARKDIELFCDRPMLHLWTNANNKAMKPKASYTLTKPQVQKVCEWLKAVKFPDGYASNIGGCVNLGDYSFYSFKSHDCHVLMQRLLPIALRGMIPNPIWEAVTELCTFFRAICSRVLHIQDLKNLEESIVVTICKLEKVFPPSFFDSMEHLVIHLAREAILGGPVQYRWMYLYERKLGSLKRTIGNKARVEGSIVESYLVKELATLCSQYFDSSIETRLNREPRNYAPDIPTSSSTDLRFSIFKVPSRRLYEKGGIRITLTEDERHKIHTYILLNCEEVQPFIGTYHEWMLQQDPGIEEQALATARDRNFASWFKEQVYKGSDQRLRNLARGPIHKVTSHKGYFVNGYKFHTKVHGADRVTHNSGVCVKGSSYNESESDYYGSLEQVLEVEYHSTEGPCIVVLFKCSWFDPHQGVKVDRKHNLVDVKYKSKGCVEDPFVLASQAEQVYYAPYPSKTKDLKDWWAVVKTKPRSIYEVAQHAIQVDDDDDADDNNGDGGPFFQESERIITDHMTTLDNPVPVNLVDDGQDVEVVNNDVDIRENTSDDEEEVFHDGHNYSDDDFDDELICSD